MIIYNLTKYINEGLTLSVIPNGWKGKDLGEDGSIILDSGGSVAHFHKRKERRFQIITRNSDRTEALRINNSMFEYLENKFNIDLPEENVNSVVYPAVRAYQISPISTSQYLGTDDNGRHEFSVNIIVITN